MKNNNTPEIGKVVQSLAGRDTGKIFVIVAVSKDDYAAIADGKYHKLNNPKRKKLKHLYVMDDKLESISDKLVKGKKVFDSELLSALKGYNSAGTDNKPGAEPETN